jgi:uncharacterized surface protein with fasciclin (FAS1) repeats
MRNLSFKFLPPKSWLKRLVVLTGVVGAIAFVSLPTLARFYPRYRLFQPYSGSGYPYRSFAGSIPDTLNKDGNFQTFTKNLQRAGLTEMLQQGGKGSFTVFAPSDKAFQALPQDVLDKLSQPENLAKVLKYHVIAGEISAADANRGEKTTLEGSQIKILVSEDGTVKLNDANGKEPSIVSNNGVIIEVDRVLFPPDF